MMNILLVSKNSESKQTVQNLISAKDDWNLIEPIDIEDGLNKYKSNNIDILIIDLECDESEYLINKITAIHPKQKTISFSKEIDCIDKKGCKFCIVNYDRKRMIKPFSEIDLLNVINLFGTNKCSHQNTLQDISQVMSYVLKKFGNCEYNIQTKLITLSDNHSFYNLKTLSEVTNILNDHNTKYKVIDDMSIQIL